MSIRVKCQFGENDFPEISFADSKKACIDYLDWGDIKMISNYFTTEPTFEDIDNFDRLCSEWKIRWSRNQKLDPSPQLAEQDAALDRE